MVGHSACGENIDGASGVFSPKGARWSGGVQVECWLDNEHYSAQKAVQRGLSVQGPLSKKKVLGLDFPCLTLSLDGFTGPTSPFVLLHESPLVIGFRDET